MRVAGRHALPVDPTIACAARGLDPCPQCVVGHFSTCLRIGEGIFTPGMSHGFTVDLGSGWSDQLVAHMSQLHVAPDAVPTVAIPLTEPLSIVVHGFLRRPPTDGAPILVVGAGIIGLAAVAALRTLTPNSEITVVTRHEHQAQTRCARCASHGDGRARGDRVVGVDQRRPSQRTRARLDAVERLSGRRRGRGIGVRVRSRVQGDESARRRALHGIARPRRRRPHAGVVQGARPHRQLRPRGRCRSDRANACTRSTARSRSSPPAAIPPSAS